MQALSELPPEFTIYCVTELGAQWVAQLAAAAADPAESTCQDLDASQVQEVDAAGVQLLMALQRRLAELGQDLRLLQPSAALTTACQRLGADHLLLAEPAAREAA
jgi:ABC-type transporter Mla MlaB component